MTQAQHRALRDYLNKTYPEYAASSIIGIKYDDASDITIRCHSAHRMFYADIIKPDGTISYDEDRR